MHEARRNERIHEFLQKRQLLRIYSKSYFDIDQGIPQPMCVVQQGVGFESLHYFFFYSINMTKEQNWPCSLGEWDGILFPPSITMTLANRRCLWALIGRRGRIVLSFKCVALPCDRAWATVWKRCSGWLRVSWRKHVLAFTLDGW